MVRRTILYAVLAGCWAAGAAAQDALPPLDLPAAVPAHKTSARKPAHPAPSGTTSVQSTWSNLVHGSPEQQALERADNDRANPAPIDRHKGEFFSDWRGLK